MFNNGWRKPSDVMSSYLDRIGAGYVIDNPEPLDFDYVPEKLVCREKFQNQLAARFSSIDKNESSCQAIISGPVGSGKLFLSKHFVVTYRDILSIEELSISHM